MLESKKLCGRQASIFGAANDFSCQLERCTHITHWLLKLLDLSLSADVLRFAVTHDFESKLSLIYIYIRYIYIFS